MMKLKLNLLTLTSVLLMAGMNVNANPVRAEVPVDGMSVCGMPVCDVTVELSRFKEMKQGARFAALSYYRTTYKSSRDLKVLQNLSDLAAGLTPLFKEVGEEDYMMREVASLSGDMLMGLAKYSALDAVKLAGFYGQIKGEGNRYQVVTFWKSRIADFEEKTPLLELITFFGKVADISTASGDPEYIAREAKSGENIITARIVELYPYFEGTYAITVKCEAGPAGARIPSFCNNQFMNRLIVMDTLGAEGIAISIVNQQTGTVVYSFGNATLTNGGTKFTSTSTSASISKLDLVLNRDTKQITGTIMNTDSLANLTITGELIDSPAAVFDTASANKNAEAVSAEALNQVYRGDFAGRAVSLTLRNFVENGTFAATMAFDAFPNQRIHFQTARFYPKMGVLTLVGRQAGSNRIKLTLFFKRTVGSKRLEVSGMAYTALNGGVHAVKLSSE
ncbi:MAG: hypothetical protein H7222_02400 [Methylotenera sp.]|nr:hypothetical protein [Oligoflexia bacterium]